jgi:hypothetical protein
MHTKRLAALVILLLAGTSMAFAKSEEEITREKQREVRADRGKTRVIENQGCPEGTYSVVTSPDGSAISILFDNFAVKGTEANGGFVRMTCGMEIPLHLPEGFSLGVYKVDYRGFAHLDTKQRGELQVDYGTGRGRANRGRRFHREVRGVYDGDFVFNESLKGGILKRMGCGDEAVLNFGATLLLTSKRGATEGTMALDSVDGAPAGGLVFGLDLKRCHSAGGGKAPE